MTENKYKLPKLSVDIIDISSNIKEYSFSVVVNSTDYHVKQFFRELKLKALISFIKESSLEFSPDDETIIQVTMNGPLSFSFVMERIFVAYRYTPNFIFSDRNCNRN